MSSETTATRHLSGQPSAQHTGTARGDEVAYAMSALARSLEYEEGSEDTMQRIVQEAIALVPGVQDGSISVVTARRHVVSKAASSELPARVDTLQEETGEGPCLDAVYEQATVRVTDMAGESRWPRFAQRAYEAGAGSMLAFQLYVEGDNLGALNLYSRDRGAFDDDSEHIGLLFASHAAVAFAGVQKQDQLSRAVATRDVIGQAKGRLIERYGLNGNQAFALLVRASQAENRKLHDIADELVSTGELRILSDDAVSRPGPVRPLHEGR